MNTFDLIDEQEFELLLLLAEMKGVRSHVGGKYRTRHKEVQSDDPRRRFATERARYASMETGFRKRNQNLFRAFTDGAIGVAEYKKRFNNELYRYLVDMYILGRRTMGVLSINLSNEEKRMLHGAHSQEMKYFKGFLNDYFDAKGTMPYAQRIDLYALGGYRLYLHGALMAVPFADLMKFGWKVHPEAEHCPDCVWKEQEAIKRGGFTRHELIYEIGLPGEKCRCGRRCRCSIYMFKGTKQLPRTRPTAFKALDRSNGSNKIGKQVKAPAGGYSIAKLKKSSK